MNIQRVDDAVFLAYALEERLVHGLDGMHRRHRHRGFRAFELEAKHFLPRCVSYFVLRLNACQIVGSPRQ